MADDSELEYLDTWLTEVTTNLVVETMKTKGNLSLIGGDKKALIFPPELLWVDNGFYKKRYKVQISMATEELFMAIFNEIVEGCRKYNRRNCAESTTVVCLPQASCVESSSFHFTVAGTTYYCWLNKGSGVDPAHAGETGIECDISGAGTAIQVAEVIDNLIDAKTGVSCDNNGTATLTIVNEANGNVTDCVDEDTGFTITVTDGLTIPSVMCNVQIAYGGRSFVEVNGRWNQDLWIDVEWSSS